MTSLQRMLLLILPVALLATPLAAHQQKESLTRVLFNARTGNIEVMHRFLLHDVEHASRVLFGASADLLGNPEDRGRFEQYVHGHFSLADQDGAAIALTPIGNEIEGQFLWVYAECPIPEDLTALMLSQDALREVWSTQTNRVNVEREKKTRSAIFDGSQSEATIRF